MLRRCLKLCLIALMLGGILWLWDANYAAAETHQQEGDENAVCLSCHSNPDLKTTLPSGEETSLYVDPAVFAASVHGKQAQKCTACHSNIKGYPHPPMFASDRRDLTLGLYTACRQCHTQQYQMTLDSVHARVLAGGDRNAPVCTDCHGAHNVTPPDQPRAKIPTTCSQCHSTIFNEYKDSVHGTALNGTDNPDVPSCVDCHGVHSMEDPRTTEFRLKSPQLCATCHTDTAKMAKYGISTNVLNSYVADFHGTTVTLFEKQTPDHPTNKAVCYDCHGIHNIKEISDPEASVVKENLLTTCRQCHPDATANFPASWVGHYNASPQRHPLVYYVQLFYRILIPGLIGFFIVFILLDIARRMTGRMQRKGA